MAVSADSGNNLPIPVPTPTPSKQEFLAKWNGLLKNGRYQLATIEDLRAKRFQIAAGESVLTEQNLATHVLIEPAIFDNPNQVRYKLYRQDGTTCYRMPPRVGQQGRGDKLDAALHECDGTRQSWAYHAPQFLVATKIELFRNELTHL